jgi:hypothetical protein
VFVLDVTSLGVEDVLGGAAEGGDVLLVAVVRLVGGSDSGGASADPALLTFVVVLIIGRVAKLGAAEHRAPRRQATGAPRVARP